MSTGRSMPLARSASHRVHLDVQTGIVVDTTDLNGTGGSSLTNEIHAVDEPLNPPS